MLKAISGIVLLAILVNISSAEEFILRFEHGTFEKANPPGGVLHTSSEQLRLVKGEGEVKELLEVHIRTAERFYIRTRIGSTAVELRGELKAPDATGKHMIKIRARVTNFTGELIERDGKLVESSNSMSSSTSLYITVDEPLVIGSLGRSPESKGLVQSAGALEHNILFVTLEPAKEEDDGN